MSETTNVFSTLHLAGEHDHTVFQQYLKRNEAIFMYKTPWRITTSVLLMLVCMVAPNLAAAEEGNMSVWYSSLYPPDWVPGHHDSQGRFLQDYSFAGYHAGEKPLPADVLPPIFDVTQPPYSADPTGKTDSTKAIQAAIDAAGALGGGTVYLPAGTYAVSIPSSTAKAALLIQHSNIRLVGDGPDKTFLRLDSHQVRSKAMILVAGESWWNSVLPHSTQLIAADLRYPTQIIPLVGTPQYEVGDWVVITHDTTFDWIQDHNMTDMWNPGAIPGVAFYRKVIAVDTENNTITIDAPIRYYLLQRDNARVYQVPKHVEEVGLSGFSIGMRQHPGTDGWGSVDYNVQGTSAWEVHDSYAIRFNHAVNSWITNVKSYRPEGNDVIHLLSNGILLYHSRWITVSHVDLRNPQYLGGGGNGYLYTLMSNDALIIHSAAYNGRHNFDFKQGYANGNVISQCYSHSPAGLQSDFHMHLSPSNLIDNITLDYDRFNAGWRGTSGTIPHGLTTTQTVLWNTNAQNYLPSSPTSIINSEQYGWGYVIGTQGPAYRVNLGSNARTLPIDFAEGIGDAAHLYPQSLYEDQLQKRLARQGIIHNPDLDFLPQLPRIEAISPRQDQTVSGHIEAVFQITIPAGDSLQDFRIDLDGKKIYAGATLPENLVIDTTALSDGRHELTAYVRSERGREGSRIVYFNSTNWWTLYDLLDPPMVTTWFGVIDQSKTSSQSAGWRYADDQPEGHGDTGRLVRSSNDEEYLIWETPQLRKYSVTVYTRPELVDYVQLAASSDQEEWQLQQWDMKVDATFANGLSRIFLTGEVSPSAKANWFRLLLPPSEIGPDDFQLGEVQLRGIK